MRRFSKNRRRYLGACVSLLGLAGVLVLWFFSLHGVRGVYYNNSAWQAPSMFSGIDHSITLERIRQKNSIFPQEHFSVSWDAWLYIGTEGEYTFSTESHDGSALWIDGIMVVDNGGYHSWEKVSGTVVLSPGLHRIQASYLQGTGMYSLTVLWQTPKHAEKEISPEHFYRRRFPVVGSTFLTRQHGAVYALFCLLFLGSSFYFTLGKQGLFRLDRLCHVAGKQALFAFFDVCKRRGLFFSAFVLILGAPLLTFFPLRGLIVHYYTNSEWAAPPSFSQREKSISLETVEQSVDTFPQRNFSVGWNGWIRIDKDGEYTFTTFSDDGSLLFIQNELLVDNSGFHPERRASGTRFLKRGIYPLRIAFMQGAGNYQLRVSWTPPGQEESAIPPDVLYASPFPFQGLEWLTFHRKALFIAGLVLLVAAVLQALLQNSPGKRTQVLKRRAQEIGLLAGSIVFMLLALEIGIRVVLHVRESRKDLQLMLKESQETELGAGARSYSLKGIVQASPHKGIVYELKPNLEGMFLNVPVRINSKGLRDYEYSVHKKDNTFRIVGLGDSSMFGWGVEMEDASLKVLERLLNEQPTSMNYEVINFGVPGYNTAIETEVFEKKCLQYSPDLVIMHFNTNDYDIPSFMRLPEKYSTLKKSYLWNFVYTRWRSLQGNAEQEITPFVFARTMTIEQSEHLDEEPDLPDEYRYMAGEKGFIRAVKKLAKATKKRGIPLIIFVIKATPDLAPEANQSEFRLKQLDVITRLSRELDFHLLNTYSYYLDYLEAHPESGFKDFMVSPHDSHPSVLAHEIEAQAFFDFLKDEQLIETKE